MNNKLKKALSKSFEAPAPTRKKAFLRSIQKPSIGYFDFVCAQAAYIRKWVWLISTLFFIVAVIGAKFMNQNMLWCVSAFMPVLALSIITESGRSEVYGMSEFELSTRFSLKSVVLAKLGILGFSNFVLFCLLIPFAYINSCVSVLQTGVYMACPYLLTIFGGLWIVRKVRGKESIYICCGIAAAVSLGNIILYQSSYIVYSEQGFIWWISALIFSLIGTVNQCYKMIKQTEELAWNS